MQVKVLYIHWVDLSEVNHLVGELRELLSPNEAIYEIEYYKDCVDYLESTYSEFDRISGCPYDKRLIFRYVNRYPWFITERTPNDKRPDLVELLNDVGLSIYDRWEYLKRTHGVCVVDRYFVSDVKNDLNYKHPWLHRSIYKPNDNKVESKPDDKLKDSNIKWD